MRLLLAFVVSLIGLAWNCAGQTGVATFTASCRSLQLNAGMRTNGGGGTLSYYATSYDSRSDRAPLQQDLGGNIVGFSGEVRPRGGQPGTYESDFCAFDPGLNRVGYGSFVLKLPTTDADANGFPDIVQFSQAANASVTGTLTNNWPATSTVALTGRFTRPANQRVGNYSLALASGGTITGTWRISALTGKLNYSRAAGTLQLTVSSDTATYTANTPFTVTGVNQFVLPQFTLAGTNGRQLTVQAGTTFNRNGNKYVAGAAFLDGIPETSWIDFAGWLFEVTDTNDVDKNGIPDLTDQVQGLPAITGQPQSQSVTAGANATFRVTATGAAPLRYQWLWNGASLAGATASALVLQNVQTNQAGNYSVVVSNAVGRVTSATAALTVSAPAPPPDTNSNQCVSAPSGKIGWWPGDGSSEDIQGGHNAVLQGGAGYMAGKVGQAFSFDGATSQVTVGAQYPDVTNNFTVELWVNPTAARTATAESVTGVTGLTGQRYAIFPRHGSASYGAGHTGAGISVGTNGVSVFELADSYMPSLLVQNMTLKGWTHVAVVYQNKQPRLYVNGVLKRTGLTSTHIVHVSADMGGPYGFYKGGMDEVGIYNRALSAAEIQAIYAAGSAGMCKPTEAGPLLTQHPGRRIQLELRGPAGTRARIETSTNLVDWLPVTEVTNETGTVWIEDEVMTNIPARFYRLAPMQ